MPIGKVICSSSYTATTRYVLEKEKAQMLKGGTMLSENSRDLVSEFEYSKRLNPDINKPCLHLILSYSQEDERLQTLSNNLLAEISEEHFIGCAVLSRWHKPLKELDKNEYKKQVEEFRERELNHYQFFSAVHEDVHHKHTHTVGSRINTLDGKCLETWQNRIKSQYVIRELEERYGLEVNQSSWEKDRKGLSRRQLEKWAETDIEPVQLQLQETIDETLNRVETVDELVEALRSDGVDMQLHQRESGEVYGVSYKKEGVAFRGSDLGKRYSIKGLEKTLIQQKEIEVNGERSNETVVNRDTSAVVRANNEAVINRDANAIARASRETIILKHRGTSGTTNGIRKLRERRTTGQITTTIRRHESTLNRIESSVRSQQQLTRALESNVRSQQQFARALADRVREIEQEQIRKELERQQDKSCSKGMER